MDAELEALKGRVSLLDLLLEDGHAVRKSGATHLARCFLHEEKTASLTIRADRYKCFGCGAKGDALDYWQHTRQVGLAEAKRALASRAGMAPPLRAARPAEPEKKWPERHAGGEAEIRQLASLRGLDAEALRVASAVGWLRFGMFAQQPAWFVTDRTGRNLQARRLDGLPWLGLPGEPKAWTMKGARASWPLGMLEAREYPCVLLVEGGPDLLAALHFQLRHPEGGLVRYCPVAMLGAGHGLPAEALPTFARKRVRIFPHADEAGARAVRRWTAQLRSVGATVDYFEFAGLTLEDGSPVNDLNDAARLTGEAVAELEELLP